MSQREHELMESVTADDQAISVSASPPRRDSMEDADSSLTRKRPRLDSGSKDNRAMSTDPSPAAADTATPPTEQQVEMTIRSQPPSSSQPTDGADDADDANAVSVSTLPAQEASEPVLESTENDPTCDNDASTDSPPVVAVDDDDDVEEAMGGYSGSASGYIQIDYDEEEYFRQFPYTHGYHGSYMNSLRTIIQHFAGGNPLDGSVLPQIVVWLDNFPDRPSQWKGYYFDKLLFWDEFALLVNKILIRRYPFGDQFCDDGQTEDDIFYDFFRSYLKLCARLLQVDTHILSRLANEGLYDQPMVSNKHIKCIHTILRQEKSPIFNLLNKDYATDIRKMGNRLSRDFIEANGIPYLLQLAEAAFNKVVPVTQNWIATWVTQIVSSLGWFLVDLPNQEHLIDRSQFCRDVLRYFRTYNVDLQAPSKVVDVAVTKELLLHFSELLLSLCQWDEQLAAELATEFMDIRDPDSPTTTSEDAINRIELLRQDSAHFPALAMNAWKFKLLRKYVAKGRMELRVTGIGIMDSALIEIWREYNTSEHQIHHPVMQYLADFLLNERVVDYIMSVDSHPQIISRSGNVVGFLVVTHRYSESQTDAIWKTVSHSQDPRVVTATINMLRNIVGLMDTPEQLYLCTKLYDLPIANYTLDIFRFFRELASKVLQRYLDWSVTDHKARPWNVCIRVIQDTAPSKESTKLTNALLTEACDQLRLSSNSVGIEERRQIYRECARHIADRSAKATGSVRAIWILCSNASFNDATFFKQNPDVARHIVEELCSFVRAESRVPFYTALLIALQYRLEMLCILVFRATEAIPVDLYQGVWDHLVGKYALNNHLRDLAWSKFSETVRHKPENEFFKQLISTYVPKLEPEYYTGGVYDFVASYRFPTTRRLVTTNEGEKELLQIRGADLLWSMVLNAPQGTIEDRSARLLAARYVEIDTDQEVTLEEVEEAHVALVEQCTQELLSAYKTIRNIPVERTASPETSDGMDIVLSDNVRQQNELRFGRTLLFEKLLLTLIRTKPEFSRSRRSDSKVEALEPELPYGDAIEIKYQSPTTNEKQSVLMGTENTLNDLYTRLCLATGFTKINLFAKGQRLNSAENGLKKIVDLDLGGLLLVQKAPGSEISPPVADNSANCSVFESTVLKHFEELFACMDADDYISGVLFDFLSCFPFRERIAEAVVSGAASADDIFPPGKVFQAKYAAHALQYKLREQLRRSTLDDSFLANAVQLLDKAHLNRALISDSLSGRHELHLAAVLVNVLLEFLKERPRQEISSCYFSNAPLLVDRLTTILSVALKAEHDTSSVAFHAYATILEASLHSRWVWEAFVDKADIPALHQTLLLTDPRKHLREQIVQSIASVCGGDLPSTSPLTGAEAATRFWTIISAILPEAIRYPRQSEQLFDIAEQVFRSHDANSRDEESLRSSLMCWSNLLLQYKHEEFVGRDETDFVVLGFTKLLLCCIPSLKSFKKPLNAGLLMEQLFRKFLFVPKVEELDEIDENLLPNVGLPVLESKTRKELYDLMLAFAEDRNSYEYLLALVGGLTNDEEDMSLKSYCVDRANEIRSSTGYVGLYNPRAICYMNSLLTQLFMNVNFRKFMLGLNVADAGTSQRLLSETQKLFAQMQNTFRKATDPREFASCVKGLDSAPIDINIQMDADEFYNLLFDQWEGQMLSPEIKQRFRSFYGGQTVNQIKSKECEHVSERVESFFVVQCDVQGKTNLQESLQAFVEGDVMEGDNKYKCESCGGKFVDAVKRTCLKDVPDNLIFHLKRFDFDLVDMRRAKINDHFEFPSCIDVSPYNVDHLSDPSKQRQEDMFELVGVLVHQGTSDNGHYYSYIRERPCPSGSLTNWVEFNDRDVDTFDHQSIPYHAFGGLYDEQFQRQQKQFSAYMLFYQRKAAIEKDHHEYISSSHCGPPKVPVPSNLEEEITADNESFVREYSLYDPNHSKFVRQILTTLRTVNHGACSEDHHQETQALHIVLEHLCQVICRLRFIDNFDETMLQLRKSVLSCSICCHIVLKWLSSHNYALIGLLLRCLHMKVRSQVRAFLIDSLRFLREKEPSLYGVENIDIDMETGTVAPIEGILVDMTRRLRKVADESGTSSRGWDDFYLTLCQLSNMGHVETAVILNSGLLEFCLRVLCMHAHTPSRMNEPEIWRLVEKKKNIFNRMIELVYTLLSKMDLRLPVVLPAAQGSDRLEKYDRTLSKFPLSQKEHNYLHYWHDENRAYAVLDKMIEQFDCTKTEVFYPGEVLKWMLQSRDPRTQEMLYVTVLEGVHALNSPFSDPYVRAALPYCEACPNANYVTKLIDAVAKSASGLRDTGGEVHIQFLSGLLTLENEAVFDEKHPDIFYEHALYRSRGYAVPLLLYDDDAVRKATHKHLEELFTKHKSDDMANETSLQLKYKSVRSLVGEMNRKISEEHTNGTSRNYMQPMIATNHLLVHLLFILSKSEDPMMVACQHHTDPALIQQYHMDIESRLRLWPQDEGTPISTGEAYEHSDYGSDSDEGVDLLDVP